jgi:tRNA dimethylallyltransferase
MSGPADGHGADDGLPQALVLAGPTGSGKSAWAERLAEHLPIEILSVDSAQVYRGLDIGSAKPDAATRARIPHRLLDLREPHEPYSAGEFARDARAAILAAWDSGRLPVLVGGTMLYLRALLHGMAELPRADATLRGQLEAEAARLGWAALHGQLREVDPVAAARIHPNDPQRIQRALEVHRLTGRPISAWQAEATRPLTGIGWRGYALLPRDRAAHWAALERRYEAMMAAGFLDEVRALRARPLLNAELPALRSVGYRQLWAHLAGETGLEEAGRLAVIATRQLARRQLTWLRSEQGLQALDPEDETGFGHLLQAAKALRRP